MGSRLSALFQDLPETIPILMLTDTQKLCPEHRSGFNK
jgi:hypothetical protein